MQLLSSADDERAMARGLAEEALRENGFHLEDDGCWYGKLDLGSRFTVPVRVILPTDFPDHLPNVYVKREDLPRRIAHHEESGKLCVAPTSGVLLDTERPDALVAYALERASRELERGISGESDADIHSEFLAYWSATDHLKTYFICDPNKPTRIVRQFSLGAVGAVQEGTRLLADNDEQAAQWCSNMGTIARSSGEAFFVELTSSFLPPEFGHGLTLQQVRSLVQTGASPADAEAFRTWLQKRGVPATVLFAIPESQSLAGRVIIGIRIKEPTGDLRKQAQAGFRPNRIPPERLLGIVVNQPVIRLDLVRVDSAFLLARGGAAEDLSGKCVLLIGAGAVGSEVAPCLCSMGIGKLWIVDGDLFRVENVHRHVLGVSSIGAYKAEALTIELRRRFPHLHIEFRSEEIEPVLRSNPEILDDIDLVILCTGDETLERRLNRVFHNVIQTIHAWVEPLGIGGHAIACGVGEAGCYECLFDLDPHQGPVNRASFTAPGQVLSRSLAGCAGTFSPFSALDANRTALEAAALVGSVLQGGNNCLVSWRGEFTLFEQLGFHLSRRILTVAPGQRTRISSADFALARCPVCAP